MILTCWLLLFWWFEKCMQQLRWRLIEVLRSIGQDHYSRKPYLWKKLDAVRVSNYIKNKMNVLTRHYSDVMMSATASQITSLTIVYSNDYSGADQRKTPKLRVTGLCVRKSLVTCEFPAQKASNAKMLRFDGVILILEQDKSGLSPKFK